MSDSCQKYLFKGISNCKNGYRFRCLNKTISYATAREIVITALMDIGLSTKDYGLHSLRAGGATPGANLGINFINSINFIHYRSCINDRLFGIPKRLKTGMFTII